VGPQPCSTIADDAMTADELASYYGMTPLYSLGDFGQGVRLAIVELEPDSPPTSPGTRPVMDECHRELSPGRWRLRFWFWQH